MDENNMSQEWTRDQFLDLFDSAAQAVEFEDWCLSADLKFLPSAAQAVLDGEPATSAYWQWLASQLEDGDEDGDGLIITVSNPRPSRYCPADEIARHNWRDFDVTIGSVRGEITLPDLPDGGTPLDAWCSCAIVEVLESLDSGDRRWACDELRAQAAAL